MSATFEKRKGFSDLLYQLDKGSIEDEAEFEDAFFEELRSGRDSWLVEGVVDHYIRSQSHCALKLLLKLPDNNSTKLLERLDHAIHGEKRLVALFLLGTLVTNDVPWIHRLIGDPLFHSLLDLLQTEEDLPVLMSGLVVVTILLPSVPSAILPHLESLFKVFCRLAEVLSAEYAGSVPDVLLLQLKVGIHAYFHRLYVMYPCNLVAYLRMRYFKPARGPRHKAQSNIEFETVIAPFMNHLRLHPHIIISSADVERSREGWRHHAPHDILVTCEKLSTTPRQVDAWATDYLGFIGHVLGSGAGCGSVGSGAAEYEPVQMASVSASRRLALRRLNYMSRHVESRETLTNERQHSDSSRGSLGMSCDAEQDRRVAGEPIEVPSSALRQSPGDDSLISASAEQNRTFLSSGSTLVSSMNAGDVDKLNGDGIGSLRPPYTPADLWSPSDIVGLTTPPSSLTSAGAASEVRRQRAVTMQPHHSSGNSSGTATSSGLTDSGNHLRHQKGFLSFVGNLIGSVIKPKDGSNSNSGGATPLLHRRASTGDMTQVGSPCTAVDKPNSTDSVPSTALPQQEQQQQEQQQQRATSPDLKPGDRATTPTVAVSLKPLDDRAAASSSSPTAGLAPTDDGELRQSNSVTPTPLLDPLAYAAGDDDVRTITAGVRRNSLGSVSSGGATAAGEERAFRPFTHASAAAAGHSSTMHVPLHTAGTRQSMKPRHHSYPTGWSDLNFLDCSLMEKFDEAGGREEDGDDASDLSERIRWSTSDDSAASTHNSTRESLSEWTSARSLLQASSSSCSSSFSPTSSFLSCLTSRSDHYRGDPRAVPVVGRPSFPATDLASSVSRSWPSKQGDLALMGGAEKFAQLDPLASAMHLQRENASSWPSGLPDGQDDQHSHALSSLDGDGTITAAYSPAESTCAAGGGGGGVGHSPSGTAACCFAAAVPSGTVACPVHCATAMAAAMAGMKRPRSQSAAGITTAAVAAVHSSGNHCMLLAAGTHLPRALPANPSSTTCARPALQDMIGTGAAAAAASAVTSPTLTPTDLQQPQQQQRGLYSHSGGSLAAATPCLHASCSHTRSAPLAMLDIVDDQMVLGAALHNSSANELPVSYQPGCDWTHFGESPHSDEIAVLQSKVLMLQSQLLLERHQRLQHAQRHRDMQSKLFMVHSVEEELHAVKEQLHLQEEEVLKLMGTVEQLRIENRELSKSHSRREEVLHENIRVLETSSVSGHEQCFAQQSQVAQLTADADYMQNELKALRAEHSAMHLDLLSSLPHASKGKQLQQQVNDLRRELIQATARTQALQDQQSNSYNKDIHLARLQQQLDQVTGEFNASKEGSLWLTNQRDAIHHKVTDMERQLAQKDAAIEQMKATLLRQQRTADGKEKASEEAITSLTRTNERLEQQIGILDGRLRLHQRQLITLEVPTADSNSSCDSS